MIDTQSELLMRVAEAERRADNTVRHGKVTDVDAKKQIARIEIGERDGKPLKSAWIPYGQLAGDYKSHRPPTKGQQLTMFAPNGEIRQAVLMPFTWSDNNKSPSEKEDEHVTTYGDKYRFREKKDLREFTLDKVKQVFTKDKITTSINGGNTPKDGNGAQADEGGTNDQEGQGSSIDQEEKNLTISASERITLKVGGSEFELTTGGITMVSQRNVIAGETYAGMASKNDASGLLVDIHDGIPASQLYAKP